MSVTLDAGDNASGRQRLWANVKFMLVAGGGLFVDGYLNTTIGLVVPILGYIYWKDNGGKVPSLQGDEIKGGFVLGMMLGQLAFGSLGDALGRRVVYGKESIFTIIGTLLVVLLPWKGLSHNSIVAWLSVFRFITGMGAGGDYPMTSALSAEHSIVGSRARLIVLIFSNNSIGSLTAGIVLLVLLKIFKGSVEANVNHFEWVWRLLLGLGIIPAACTLYARLRMRESKAYEQYVAQKSDHRGYRTQLREFREYFSEWKHARVLLATAASWFLYDIASYGLGLNQSIVLSDIGYAGGKTEWERMWKVAVGNIIVSLAGWVPGVYMGVFLPDIIGRRMLQAITCFLACIFFAIWAGVSNVSSSGGLIALFTLSQLALGCGPNVTTFLIPAEVFPTRVRGTAHGISAASGKAGALLTAYAFATMTDKVGLRGVLGLLSGLLFIVALITFIIPEPKGRTLDEIEHGKFYGPGASEEDIQVADQANQSVKTEVVQANRKSGFAGATPAHAMEM